jgi:predicted metal-dependent enzyme (double-stranded beta helix superfamily)
MATTDVEQHTTEHLVETLDRATMLDIACGIASAAELWGQHVRHDATERRPVRLLATEAYEVWVIGWTTGQGVTLHDHGGSSGVVVVTEGRLTERAAGREPRRLEVGAVSELGPDDVHEVFNAEDEPATSVHVYSPPLAAMGYHLTDAPGVAVAIEALRHEEPAVAGEVAARALHPARR